MFPTNLNWDKTAAYVQERTRNQEAAPDSRQDAQEAMQVVQEGQERSVAENAPQGIVVAVR